MCGRFTRHRTVNDFVRLIPGLTGETQARLNPRYNIAPSQALLLAQNGEEWVTLYWAKEPKLR